MTAPPANAVTGWIGRRLPEGGECGSADESRCLERPDMKPSQSVASSPAAAYLAPVRAQ